MVGQLEGRVAIVTGASRGLGRDIAFALGRAGAAVVVAARTEAAGESRIPGTLEEAVTRIEQSGARALAVRCDVTNQADISRTVQETIAAFGRIDILVNNAGILTPGSVVEMQPRHWDLAFRVNVHGPFLFCREVISHLARAGGGHIINISSRGAIGPGPGPYDGPRAGGTAYGATKAALERLSQGLAVEVCHQRIAVNALSPHRSIWSEGGHHFRRIAGEPAYRGWRMSGEIIGDAAVVICAQEPGAFTGHILYDELVMRQQGGLSEDEIQQRYPVVA